MAPPKCKPTAVGVVDVALVSELLQQRRACGQQLLLRGLHSLRRLAGLGILTGRLLDSSARTILGIGLGSLLLRSPEGAEWDIVTSRDGSGLVESIHTVQKQKAADKCGIFLSSATSTSEIVLIGEIIDGGLAAKAGLIAGLAVTSINGKAVKGATQASGLLKEAVGFVKVACKVI